MARPTNYAKVQPDDVKAVFERIDSVGAAVSGLYFVGDEVLGFPNQLSLVAAEMKKRGMSLAMLEHYTQLQFKNQDGMFALGELSGYSVARLHQLLKVEQPKLSVAEAIHRQVLGSRERNIRIQYLKMYQRPLPGKSLIETHVALAASRTGWTPTAYRRTGHDLSSTCPIVVASDGGDGGGRRAAAERDGAAAATTAIRTGGAAFGRAGTAVAIRRGYPATADYCLWQRCAVSGAGDDLAQMDRWQATAPRGGASLGRIMLDGITGVSRTFLMAMVGGIYLAALLADTRFCWKWRFFAASS